jgi:hypothetical protein
MFVSVFKYRVIFAYLDLPRDKFWLYLRFFQDKFPGITPK